MPSVPTVADPRRGWIALQADLGGDEAILDVPLAAPSERSAQARVATGRQPAKVAGPASEGKGHPPARTGELPAWLVDAPPIPGPGLVVEIPTPPSSAAWKSLDDIVREVASCHLCPLGDTRTMTVPGEGNPDADLMVVGEGPGEQEDLTGRPFVGPAGKLLDRMLASIGLPRESVFIANVVKCRPPRNRAPLPDERDACMPYLLRQVELVRPRVILALGGTAAVALLGVKQTLARFRLKVHTFNGVPLVVTYHPAALLRNPNWKRPAWDDVRIARQLVDYRD